ncbi:MAG: UvrD-helicase domain-containing protein [Prevotella sp.]|jgi:ATP-dependent exoDNAse (exonuclease V) beta subunit
MASNNKPLTVYKASAGSGKTFTLTVEYIKLLVQEPQNYRYILAVTFTNKATEEMKMRILSQLYGISNELPDSEAYMERMREAFPNRTDENIRNRAKEALELILHHYHYFRVETIDSFFQSILRNLARELGLTANLQVGLNDAEVESQAVDNIIESIEQDNDPLLSWIMDFVKEKVDDEKNWNVIGQIKEFGKNIFKDFYKDHQQELRRIMNDADFFKEYSSKLRAMKKKANETMAAFAKEYQDIAERYQLEDAHFSRGNQNAPGYFAKLASGDFAKDDFPSKTMLKACIDPTTMVRKADIDTVEAQIIIDKVGPLLERAEEERKKMCIIVNSIDLTLRNLHELRLLGRIEQEVSNINTNTNNYPLSNTQKLLSSLIDKQDSPFIYEKTGAQLRYIMIDEFQDTSTVQWDNFKVLLDDCLAHNNGSLIVGDVKQSIYRWRNGDWRLLQNLTPENDNRIQIKPLDTNYRSRRNIIRFNNTFFKLGAKITSDEALSTLQAYDAPVYLLQEALDIRRAYEDVTQKISPKHLNEKESKAGMVRIKLLPRNDYENNVITEVQYILEYLLSSGIPSKKIAVLVRKNTDIQLLANYFQQNHITVNGEQQMISMVSDEAFRLDASLAVCTIVRAMYLLVHPDDNLVTAALVKVYQKICSKENSFDDSRLFVDNDDLRTLLPIEMTEQSERLLSTPLVDMAEQLYHIFKLDKLDGQSAYVCAFFDQLSIFMHNHIVTVEEFIKEWENTIAKKAIHSDEVNGIRLLTIHKSKGLEFDNVIIPYCDWDMEKQGEVIWMKPQEEPYNELPVVPINLSSKKLQESIYDEEYQSEHLKNYVDNLNLLYVAFTRAGNNLFIIGRNEYAKYPSTLIKQVIDYRGTDSDYTGDVGQAPDVSLLDFLPEHTVENDENNVTTFQLGSLCLAEDEKEKATRNVFEQTEEGIKINIQQYKNKAVFRQSNNSTDFITPDEELEQQQKQRSYIQTGNILHTLFASIRTIDDVGRAIDQMEFDGVLYDKPMNRSELRRIIDERMRTPQVAEWFSPTWKVFNECTILSYDQQTGQVKENRPDRVIYNEKEMIVIDFKTGKEYDSHHVQVRNYMNLLRSMGYDNVSGFLWYIRTNRIVSVS